MADPNDKRTREDDYDASSLAALVSPSTAPPADDADAGDDGVLDLRALAASMAPGALETEDEETASEPSTGNGHASTADATVQDAAPSKPKAAGLATREATTPAPAKVKAPKAENKAKAEREAKPANGARPRDVGAVAASKGAVLPATPETSGSGRGVWLGLLALIVVGGVGWYFYDQSQRADEPDLAEGPEAASGPTHLIQPQEPERIEVTPVPEAALPAEATPEGDEAGATGDEAGTTEDQAGGDQAGAPAPSDRERAPRVAATPSANPATSTTAETSMAAAETTMAAATMAVATAATTMTETATTDTTMAEATAMGSAEASTGMVLDSVLDDALGTMTAPAAMTEASAALPSEPSRANVARTLGGLLPGIRQCAGEQVGLANAAILIDSDGSVATVTVSGSPFGGTPQGACMEGVIRRAQFERFSDRTFQVRYPFAIRPTQ